MCPCPPPLPSKINIKILPSKLTFRDRKGKRETQMRDLTLTGCLLHGPYQELNMQPRYVSWLGLEPAISWFLGRGSTTESHQLGLLLSPPPFFFFWRSVQFSRSLTQPWTPARLLGFPFTGTAIVLTRTLVPGWEWFAPVPDFPQPCISSRGFGEPVVVCQKNRQGCCVNRAALPFSSF